MDSGHLQIHEGKLGGGLVELDAHRGESGGELVEAGDGLGKLSLDGTSVGYCLVHQTTGGLGAALGVVNRLVGLFDGVGESGSWSPGEQRPYESQDEESGEETNGSHGEKERLPKAPGLREVGDATSPRP